MGVGLQTGLQPRSSVAFWFGTQIFGALGAGNLGTKPFGPPCDLLCQHAPPPQTHTNAHTHTHTHTLRCALAPTASTITWSRP